MTSKKSFLQKRVLGIYYAFRGIATFVQVEFHAKVHLAATILVVAAGIYFNIDTMQWCVICLTLSSVWVAEALNTAIELVVDMVSPQYHPLAEKAKDIAAAAVLIASIFAFIIGILIFVPKFIFSP